MKNIALIGKSREVQKRNQRYRVIGKMKEPIRTKKKKKITGVKDEESLKNLMGVILSQITHGGEVTC